MTCLILQKGFLSFSVQPLYHDIMNRLTRTSVSRFLAAPYLLLLLCRHVSLYCSPYLFVLLSIFRRTRYCCVTVNFHMGGGNKFCPDYLQGQSCKCSFFRTALKLQEFFSCKIYWLACHLMWHISVAFFLKEEAQSFNIEWFFDISSAVMLIIKF